MTVRMSWGNFTRWPNNRLLRAVCAALVLAWSSLGFSPVHAQNTVATVRAEAIVVAPLALVANEDLNFGRIAPTPAGGTVTLNPDTNVCTTTGTIVRVGTCQPAEFSGMGIRRMRLRIQIPTTITLTRVGGTQTMTVDNVTLDSTPDLVFVGGNGNGLGNGNRRYEIVPNNGIFDFRIGGRLNVGPNQLGGTYNGTFVVTVQYQ
jgi:spore coat protein U-like protein